MQIFSTLSLPLPSSTISANKKFVPPSFPSSSFRCEMVGEKGRESGIGRGGAITSKKRPPKKGGGESSSVSPRPPRPPRPPRSPLLSRPFLNYAMQEMEKRETFPPSSPPLTFIAVFLFPRFPCFNFLSPPPPPSLPPFRSMPSVDRVLSSVLASMEFPLSSLLFLLRGIPRHFSDCLKRT